MITEFLQALSGLFRVIFKKVRINMFNKTDVNVTVNNSYTVENGGILVVNTSDETADKIIEVLNRPKREPEQITQEPKQ